VLYPPDEKPTWLHGVDSTRAAVAGWPDLAFLRRVGRGRHFEVPWRRHDEACLEFGEGFFDAEKTPSGGTFRWLGSQGVIRFMASGTDAQIDLTADVPLWALDGQPEVEMSINGHRLQRTVATSTRLVNHISLPRELLRVSSMNEVVVSVSKTFVPAEVGKGSDRRRLGLRVLDIAVRRPETPATPGSPGSR